MSPVSSSQTTTSSNAPIQVGTEGLIIELTLMGKGKPMDISSATLKNIVIKPPSGMNITKTASFTTDGLDGKIRCFTSSGDLALVGTYQVQGYVELLTFKGFSGITSFDVVENL
jgi:hypothetical protein